jgi:two-component system, LuxR family, sensor kinase FixL
LEPRRAAPQGAGTQLAHNLYRGQERVGDELTAGEVRRGRIFGYGVAVAAVAAAYLARVGLGPLVGDRSQFLLFILPVLLSTLNGGLGPALLATFLALGAGMSLFPPGDALSSSVQLQALLFVLVCAGIVWLGGRAAGAHRLSEAHRRDAQTDARAAAESREGLRLLLEGAASYAIFMVDGEGIVTSWNSGAERTFGWREDEIVGRPSSIFYPPQEVEDGRPSRNLARALDEGRFTEESWQVRKDGSEFLADLTITALKDKDGRLRGFAKVIHDVTDRRAAERALQKRERHLQSILATVPDAMVVIDERGIIISFSAAAERLFGYSEAELLGRNVSLLMPSPDRDRHDAYLDRYLETGERRIIGLGRIVTGLRADGTTFPMKLSVGEALSEDQRLFTGFVQDLTERQNFEARLEELKSELIHVSRLSAMGTMASTLAHELNQPLTAIANYAEAAGTILEEPDQHEPELLREILGDIAAQSLRAGAIVRRLRDFVARGDVAKNVENLPNLINEASALALVGSREKGIAVQFNYDPEATPVLVDKVQIQQVLMNLMRNAIEAMEGCPVRKLTIATALIDPATVQVTVSDTGPGVSAGMEERLFEAFASTKSSGMGLGLSICRTIVESHGGRIKARPAAEGGTEFQFTLLRPAMEDA